MNGAYMVLLIAVIALMGFVVALAPMFREMYKDRKRATEHENIREIVREEVMRILEEKRMPTGLR